MKDPLKKPLSRMEARRVVMLYYPGVEFTEVEQTTLGTFVFIVGNELIVRVSPDGTIHEESKWKRKYGIKSGIGGFIKLVIRLLY